MDVINRKRMCISLDAGDTYYTALTRRGREERYETMGEVVVAE